MDDLSILRGEIDDIDSKLIELFEKRMDMVLSIAQYKKENKINVEDIGREKEVIRKSSEKLKDKRLQTFLEKFINELMKVSKEAQDELIKGDRGVIDHNKKLIVGFQGVSGSFSEQALFEYFNGNVLTRSVPEFEDIFLELKNDNIDYGILPIENSSTGSITDVYDLLNKYDYKIVGEICLKIDQNLLGLKGATLSDINEVYSITHALNQCSEYLKIHGNWEQIPYSNTAKAAEYVSRARMKSKAAIASRKAAELYDLEILAGDINSNLNNSTRFIIVAKELEINSFSDKISVVFAVEHKVGALYAVLRSFAENNLSLLKIESRPIADKPWEYFFYVDFEGNLRNEKVLEAIERINKESSYFEILGNYKKQNFII